MTSYVVFRFEGAPARDKTKKRQLLVNDTAVILSAQVQGLKKVPAGHLSLKLDVGVGSEVNMVDVAIDVPENDAVIVVCKENNGVFAIETDHGTTESTTHSIIKRGLLDSVLKQFPAGAVKESEYAAVPAVPAPIEASPKPKAHDTTVESVELESLEEDAHPGLAVTGMKVEAAAAPAGLVPAPEETSLVPPPPTKMLEMEPVTVSPALSQEALPAGGGASAVVDFSLDESMIQSEEETKVASEDVIIDMNKDIIVTVDETSPGDSAPTHPLPVPPEEPTTAEAPGAVTMDPSKESVSISDMSFDAKQAIARKSKSINFWRCMKDSLDKFSSEVTADFGFTKYLILITFLYTIRRPSPAPFFFMFYTPIEAAFMSRAVKIMKTDNYPTGHSEKLPKIKWGKFLVAGFIRGLIAQYEFWMFELFYLRLPVLFLHMPFTYVQLCMVEEGKGLLKATLRSFSMFHSGGRFEQMRLLMPWYFLIWLSYDFFLLTFAYIAVALGWVWPVYYVLGGLLSVAIIGLTGGFQYFAWHLTAASFLECQEICSPSDMDASMNKGVDDHEALEMEA